MGLEDVQNADALDLARQLAGTVQGQLQKQRDDARDREQRAMDLELERERRADVRESRLFDHFRDYLDTTRSNLKDAALVREKSCRSGAATQAF